MRKKLLITTALVALVSVSNARAADATIIDKDTTIVGREQGIDADGPGGFIVSNGNFKATNSYIHANGIQVTGGTTTLNGTDFTNDSFDKSFKLTDGKIVIKLL